MDEIFIRIFAIPSCSPTVWPSINLSDYLTQITVWKVKDEEFNFVAKWLQEERKWGAKEKAASLVYDGFSVEPFIWVREMDESESGQMVLEKVKGTFFDAYLWQTMWNHAKKSVEGSKLSDLVFLQWEVTDWQELFAINAENKGN